MVVKADETVGAPMEVTKTNEGATLVPRHYVRCIDASDSAGNLLEGRVYEVAIEVSDAATWRGVETGFVLGNYSAPVGDGKERFIVWPYVWSPTRFVPVSPEELKIEDNGRLTSVDANGV